MASFSYCWFPTTLHYLPPLCPQHLVRILNDPDVFLSELLPVQRQQSLRDLREAREFGLFVNVLLPVFFLKEVLENNDTHTQRKKKVNTCWARFRYGSESFQ